MNGETAFYEGKTTEFIRPGKQKPEKTTRELTLDALHEIRSEKSAGAFIRRALITIFALLFIPAAIFCGRLWVKYDPAIREIAPSLAFLPQGEKEKLIDEANWIRGQLSDTKTALTAEQEKGKSQTRQIAGLKAELTTAEEKKASLEEELKQAKERNGRLRQKLRNERQTDY